MANRRMFSNRIANSARFLQMPAESQLLYFHMILRADDDGVVESYPLIKLLGVPLDNFKILLAKSFIRQLNEDQVIVIIDWLEHNTIRSDRKVDSIYKTLLLNKAPDIKTITPKPRSDVEDNSQRLGGQSTDGISKVRLGKDKISKESIADKSASHDFKDIITYYHTLVLNSEGFKPEIRAKDCALVKSILKRYPKDEVKEIIYHYLSGEKASKLGIDLSIALSAHSINQYLSKN